MGWSTLDSTASNDHALPSAAPRLILRLGARRLSVAIDSARGVIPWRAPTRLPGAPAHVAGLINLRGTVVTVIDLGRLIAEESSSGLDGSILLIRRRASTIGLAVDEVVDVTAQIDAHAGAESLDLDRLVSDVLSEE